MKGNERRENIINELMKGADAVSAGTLAKKYGVSRQVIVQDVALLRAQGLKIQSTPSGYILESSQQSSRVFKSIHSDEETAEELTICVDLGGCVEDVFVYHRAYGVIRADLSIRSRLDIQRFMESISNGHSHFLKNITSGYHYHTVTAGSREILDLIQEALTQRGFLAPLTDYEPVDFREDGEARP